MVTASIPQTFGDSDSELVTVDLPQAYLRFLLSIDPYGVSWFDANYETAKITSEQLSYIETGTRRVAAATNGDMDANRISQIAGLGMMLPGLRAMWVAQPGPGQTIPDKSGNGVGLDATGQVQFGRSLDGLPEVSLDSSMFFSTLSDGLIITGTEDREFPLSGLTLMAWVDIPGDGVEHVIIERSGAGDGYSLRRQSGGKYAAIIGVRGLSLAAPGSGYRFVVAKWSPSNSISIGVDETYAEITSNIPAAIAAATRPTNVAKALSAGALFKRLSFAAICAQWLDPLEISRFYMATKRAYQ